MSPVAKKVVEVQEQVDQDLLKRSKLALEKRKFNFQGYSEDQIIQTAKLVCDVQAEMSVEKRQDEAKKLENILKKETVKDFKTLATEISDLVKSEIGSNPTKSYSASINTNTGNVIVGITAYQDVEKPEVNQRKTAKQTVGEALTSMIEQHGLQDIEKMLMPHPFSYGVQNEPYSFFKSKSEKNRNPFFKYPEFYRRDLENGFLFLCNQDNFY